MAYEPLIDHLDQSRALGGSDRGRWFGATCSGSSGHSTFDNYIDVLLVLEALIPGVAMVVAKAHKRYHHVEEKDRQPECQRSAASTEF